MNTATVDLLNRQIGRELYSELLYIAVSVYFEAHGFFNFAKWALEHSAEEHKHALKIIRFLQDRRQCVVLPAIDAAVCNCETPVLEMQAVFEHEQFITTSINEIAAHATQISDFATFEFIQWYIREQVEEEKTVSDYLLQMQNSFPNLMMLDLELA